MIEIQTFVLMFEFRVLFRTFIFTFWRDGGCADIIKRWIRRTILRRYSDDGF